MRLGRQMHDGVGLVLVEHALHLLRIADVDLLEEVARIIQQARQRTEIPGIGQFVHVNHRDIRLSQKLPNHGRANESGSTGNDYFLAHHWNPCRLQKAFYFTLKMLHSVVCNPNNTIISDAGTAAPGAE
jgi:hypothetical protein